MNDVAVRMREDWNKRAQDDAHYFVAFGRRQQDDEEFFDSARDLVLGLKEELKRFPKGNPRARRALEIGCGPGRLLRPLSDCFGEIHGVDVSDEMVRRARQKLAHIPHAHAHHAPNSDLSAFADLSFDLVYSYAVFQHIPSRDVVFGYLREACRVLKPGGIIRCQMNGFPETSKYDTWSGVRISANEVREFAVRNDLDLLALEGVLTQYMWVTLRKPDLSSPDNLETKPSIRMITNTHSTEPVATVHGRYSAISAWVENLPPRCDLNRMQAHVGGKPGNIAYIGPIEQGDLRPISIALPSGLSTGLHPLRLTMNDMLLCPEVTVRLLPPGPPLPYLVSLRDGIDLCGGTRITSGTVKITVDEVPRPDDFHVTINGVPQETAAHLCTDPRLGMYEFDVAVPQTTPTGPCEFAVYFGQKLLQKIQAENAPA